MRSRTRGGNRRAAMIVVVASAIVIADQLTKTWAERRLVGRSFEVFWTLRFQVAYNPGVAFSFGTGSTGTVTVAALAILAIVIVVAWRSSGLIFGVALGLIMGGAVGNLVDRLVRHNGGRVIDFIDFRWFPVFNIADMGITCGVILALLVGDRSRPHAKIAERQPPAARSS